MLRREETIREVPAGWERGGTTYASAVAAQRAVCENDKFLAESSGDTVVTVLTWEPVTRVGRAVLAALGVKGRA